MKGAVILLSGGVDSSTLLAHVIRDVQPGPVHALSFRYGQKHAREIDMAVWQAQRAGAATHRIVDVSVFGSLTEGSSALTDAHIRVPDLGAIPAADLRQPVTYVPNRNMMLLSMAAAYAESLGVADLFYGAQAQDEYGYWDCTAEFLARLNHVLALNRRQPVVVRAPFIAWRKADVVRLGLKLGVDFEHTWTCYRGGAAACGTCPSCVERDKAFQEVLDNGAQM
jgi:7-cyano-7-deazaguanine synthase